MVNLYWVQGIDGSPTCCMLCASMHAQAKAKAILSAGELNSLHVLNKYEQKPAWAALLCKQQVLDFYNPSNLHTLYDILLSTMVIIQLTLVPIG